MNNVEGTAQTLSGSDQLREGNGLADLEAMASASFLEFWALSRSFEDNTTSGYH